MKQIFYIPKEGVLIRNHDGRGHLPPEGALRMQNQYYDRRVKDGDLIVRDEGTPAQPAPEITGKTANQKKGDK